ncbi:uncharacterized protein LOC123634788 [Lemur catta]|uniref:uncharacterized protein LOC123634788 n=1 Tax=Lemur catta TaxID=9447 RepID=UPI001E2666C7|nr:uncharacterized protein LOC123634788 [Lemur catta]
MDFALLRGADSCSLLSLGQRTAWADTGLPEETKEAWGALREENPSSDNFVVSFTSLYSFSEDLGYQGSQELTTEEDPSFLKPRRQKRNKFSILQIRRNEVKEEDEEDEDEAEGPPTSLQSPRTKYQQRPHSGIPQVKHSEQLRILESSLSSSSTSEAEWSCGSLATFCQYFCSCCPRTQKSMEETKASGSEERKCQSKIVSVSRSISGDGPELQGAPRKKPEARITECNPSACK